MYNSPNTYNAHHAANVQHTIPVDDINPDDMKNPDTAIWVLECRRRMGMQMTPFATMLGVSYGTLLSWESGNSRPTGKDARDALIAAGKNVGMPDLPASDRWGRGILAMPSNLEAQFAKYFGS